jgi:hypothetical protein
MASNNEWPPLPLATVIGATVVGALVSLGWVLPGIIHSLGEAIALAIAAATAGVATAAPIAAWVAPAAGLGIAATGAATVFIVLVKAAKEVRKDPYEWTVPLLGILGGLVLDIAKEFAVDNNPMLKAGLTAVIAFLVVVAGALWKTKDWLWRTVAVVFLSGPPVAVLVQNLEPSGAKNVAAEIWRVPTQTWLRLGGFIVLGVTVALVHGVTERRSAR